MSACAKYITIRCCLVQRCLLRAKFHVTLNTILTHMDTLWGNFIFKIYLVCVKRDNTLRVIKSITQRKVHCGNPNGYGPNVTQLSWKTMSVGHSRHTTKTTCLTIHPICRGMFVTYNLPTNLRPTSNSFLYHESLDYCTQNISMNYQT